MKTLNIMSLDFVYKASIGAFEAIVNRVWNGIGSLTVTINSEITNADLIQKDDLIWFDREYNKVFIIEKIEEKLSGNTTNYEITALSLNTLLKDYITIPSESYDIQTGTREAIVRAWVDTNCINPTDLTRAQYPIVLGTIKGLGNTITEQTRYKVLTDEISRVLLTEDLGYGLELDIPNQRFVFNVYQGVNRTSIQSVNSRILFGLKYGNISDYRKVSDNTSTKNVIYVAGQGEGADRTIVKVTGAGTRKKEIFIDARDTNVESELTERGNQKLNELAEINNYEFETIDRQFKYGIDYDLGDFVTVVIDKNTKRHLQLKKVQEIYEAGKISIIPEFGQPEKTITSIMSTTSKRILALETESSDSSEAVGIGLNYSWDGTELGIKREDESSYAYTDLKGPQGIEGPQGPKGETGAEGPQGIQGPKGDTGSQGIQGIQGPEGQDGLTISVNGVAQVGGNVTLTKSHLGLSDVLNYGIATQAEAQAGTSNIKYMTPLQTKNAINASAEGVTITTLWSGDTWNLTGITLNISENDVMLVEGYYNTTNMLFSYPFFIPSNFIGVNTARLTVNVNVVCNGATYDIWGGSSSYHIKKISKYSF
jgi:uncharacterized FlaG/YvyC family protein